MSTTIRVITVVKMLWTHEAQPSEFKTNVKHFVRPYVHKRPITILLTSIGGVYRHLIFLTRVASSFFTSASPFLVPVLYNFHGQLALTNLRKWKFPFQRPTPIYNGINPQLRLFANVQKRLQNCRGRKNGLTYEI